MVRPLLGPKLGPCASARHAWWLRAPLYIPYSQGRTSHCAYVLQHSRCPAAFSLRGRAKVADPCTRHIPRRASWRLTKETLWRMGGTGDNRRDSSPISLSDKQHSSISRSPGSAVSPASLSTACIYYGVSRSTCPSCKSPIGRMTLCNQVPSRTSNTASSSNDSKVAGRLTGARTLRR